MNAEGSNSQRVSFSTTRFEGAEVGAQLGDELERLGFTLQSVSDTEVDAIREDGTLRVTLYTEPASVKRAGQRVYPTVSPSAVVVLFESI
jgi:hypothetical protein